MEIILFSNKFFIQETFVKSIFKESNIKITHIYNFVRLQEILLNQQKKYIAILVDLQICTPDHINYWDKLLSSSPLPLFLFSSDTKIMYREMLLQKFSTQLAKPLFEMFEYLHKIKEEKFNLENSPYIPLTSKMSFNIGEHCIEKFNKRIPLSIVEFKLLYLLLSNRGEVFSANELLDKLELSGLSTLYVHIQNVRSKIEDDPHNPNLLINCRGQGYKLL
ncbi:winged helix-turn-helix domain-containing protein [Paenibacillus sp. OAE614]|uniref:winged helix-turn-helix domain-containing protein n=1 Tax=Paenibacillus sp. OAE614 TaxID=2663804 RepID=UPI001789F326